MEIRASTYNECCRQDFGHPVVTWYITFITYIAADTSFRKLKEKSEALF